MITAEESILKKVISKSVAFTLILTAIFGCSYFSNREIKSVSEKVFEAILKGNGQLVWNYSTTDFKNVIDKEHGGLENFGNELSNASKSYRDLTSWEIVDVIDFGDAATVQIYMKYSDQFRNHRYFLYLKKESGVWKLDRPRVMDT